MKNLEKVRINELIPEQLRETASNLVSFLKVYYTQQNETDAPTQLLSFIDENHDLDRIDNERFIDALAQSVAKDVPKSDVVERTRLLKRLVDYYNAKGTEKSVKIFFKLFFNKLVRVAEPWDLVLFPSDGRFEKNIFVRAVPNSPNAITSSLIGKRIFQLNDFNERSASGVVDRIEKKVYDETIVTLYLDQRTVFGTFNERNKLIDADGKEYGRFYRTLKNIRINPNNTGTGYSIGDKLFLDTRNNSSFEAFVTSVDSEGRIKDVSIADPGAGNTISSTATVASRDFQRFGRNNEPANNSPRSLFRIRTNNEVMGPFSPAEFNYDLEFGVLVDTLGKDTTYKGKLSNITVTRDSDLYQPFAYEVVSDVSYNEWKKSFTDLIHPDGYRVFSRFIRQSKPAVGFGFNNSILELRGLFSEVFQPGDGNTIPYIYNGFNFKGERNFTGSPSVDRADENLSFSATFGLARQDYTLFQNRDTADEVFMLSSEPLAQTLTLHTTETVGITRFFNGKSLFLKRDTEQTVQINPDRTETSGFTGDRDLYNGKVQYRLNVRDALDLDVYRIRWSGSEWEASLEGSSFGSLVSNVMYTNSADSLQPPTNGWILTAAGIGYGGTKLLSLTRSDFIHEVIAAENDTPILFPTKGVRKFDKADIEEVFLELAGRKSYPENNYFMEDFVNENPIGGGFL
tara:strand:+ start:7063 stop:9114 length:2052 start_codon:yes stop_codon:yes gene_type:complete